MSTTRMRRAQPLRRVDPLILVRLGLAVVVGVVVGLLCPIVLGLPSMGLLAGWIAFCLVFLSSTWIPILRMDAAKTATHATREDPTIPISHTMVLLASVASLAGDFILFADHSQAAKAVAPFFVVAGVAASWLVVHTLFTLRYASIYYRGPDGGVDFNEKGEGPAYGDFAYLAFTIGMTYQVSDTDLTSKPMRRTALRHAMLSYLLGTVVIAATINLVAGLAK